MLDICGKIPAYWPPMKYPTLQKVSLITTALVASLALSAQAGQRAPAKTVTIKHSTSATASGDVRAHLPNVKRPADVLYDQYDNLSGSASLSATFTDFLDFSADLADDFNVPAGDTWTIESLDADGLYFNGSGPATDWNLFIYNDASGKPGSIVASQMNMPISVSGTTFTFNLSPSVPLSAGHYWIELQANMTFATEGEWGWTDRTVQSNSPAQWQNPGGGFGICQTWGDKLAICIPTAGGPDQVFRVNGTSANGTPTPTPTPTPAGNALWYNGDFNGEATGNGLANEQDTSLGSGEYARVYDDFNVTDPNGWDIGSVFSNNLENTNVTAATFEIRSGVSAGNGGTIVASGMTVTPEVTATGRSGFGFTEFMIQISDLNIHLAPGTYWLNVTPVGDLTGRSFNSTTAGANCVGTPCGDDDNAFWDSNFFAVSFVPTQPQCVPPNECIDFSMGVNSTGTTGGITLQALVKTGHQTNKVLLKWSPANGGKVSISRNGVVIGKTADDGKAKDVLGNLSGDFTYQVCETDTGTCSNEVTVTVP